MTVNGKSWVTKYLIANINRRELFLLFFMLIPLRQHQIVMLFYGLFTRFFFNKRVFYALVYMILCFKCVFLFKERFYIYIYIVSLTIFIIRTRRVHT